MSNKKYKPPANMNDLTALYYGSDKTGSPSYVEINRYEKHLRNPSCWSTGLNIPEQEVKKFLERIGNVTKVNEDNQIKLPDFTIESKAVFFEVKSINTVYKEPVSENIFCINIKSEPEFIDKINLALNDFCSKQVGEKMVYCGVLWVDVTQNIFTMVQLNKDFIDKTNLKNKKLDGLLIVFQSSSGNITPKKNILFSKNSVLTKMFENYDESGLEIINC